MLDLCWQTVRMIILAATPIGNLGDASQRLIDALSSASVVAAEDTRVAIRLMHALGIENRPQLLALHEHNETARVAELVDLAGRTDLLVLSDAGMPGISDPGFALVSAAASAGVRVTVLPGPSAVVAALAISGLPTDRFSFEGFFPRKGGDRRAMLAGLATETRTMVFFESPNRLAASLAEVAAIFGPDRRVAVARELTKLFEEVRRGTAAELAAWAASGIKGEICVVIAGSVPVALELDIGVGQVLALVAGGTRLKEAAAEVSEATGLGRRDLYQGALKARLPPAPPPSSSSPPLPAPPPPAPPLSG